MNFRRVACLLTISLGLLCGLYFWRAHRRGPPPPSPDHPPSVSMARSNRGSTPWIETQIKNLSEPSADSSLNEASAVWARSIPEPKFARFAEWAERYVRAPRTDKPALETEGVE